MNFFKKIIYLAILIAAARALGMQPGEEQQPGVELNLVPDVPFFNVIPTLKQATELKIIKQLINDPNLIDVFLESNTPEDEKRIPEDLKNITRLANIFRCMIDLSKYADYEDSDLLASAFDRGIETIAKEENKADLLELFQCIRRETSEVFNVQKLADLWLLLLNDPEIHAKFPGGKNQTLLLLVSSFIRVMTKNQYRILSSWYNNFPALRKEILKLLVELSQKNLEDFATLNTRFSLEKIKSQDETCDIYVLGPILESEQEFIKEKNKFFQFLSGFFGEVSIDAVTSNLMDINKIIESAYESDDLSAVGSLLTILFQKGANPNIEIKGVPAAIYFFGRRGVNLFGQGSLEYRKANKYFLIFLIQNGLDITEIQLVPSQVTIPTGEGQQGATPLQIAQKNYHAIISQDSALKNAIEKFQREYVQNKIKQESRGKN